MSRLAGLESNVRAEEGVPERLESGVAALPNDPRPVRTRESVQAPRKGKWVRIMLEDNVNIPPGGQFFGINGQFYRLMPGFEAEVPIGLLQILDDAIEGRPIIHPISGRISGWRKVRRYPYIIVSSRPNEREAA